VRLAANKETEEYVAVKCITSAEILRDFASIVMIQSEIKLIKSLTHPNICRFIEVYARRMESTCSPECRIVLEYLEGGTLSSLIQKSGNLSETVCWYLLKQILAAISYCHSRNIVHRDCKLENLMLTYGPSNRQFHQIEHATVKLIDFGFATIAETESLFNICGTPEYIAPEIISRQPYGKPVDMWSLGVIAFVLSSSYFPFRGSNLSIIFRCISSGEFQWISKSNNMYSASFKTFVSNLLRVSPKDRYNAESAGEYAAQISC
jgi:calcium/calmodulin-dependent protein kinase I